jgi:hypothetical protein
MDCAMHKNQWEVRMAAMRFAHNSSPAMHLPLPRPGRGFKMAKQGKPSRQLA